MAHTESEQLGPTTPSQPRRPLWRGLIALCALLLPRLACTSLMAAAMATPAAGTWSPIEPPAGAVAGHFRILAPPSSRTTLYASSGSVVGNSAFWSSLDGGGTWSFASGLRQAQLNAVDPVDATTVYADDGREVWKSMDGAVTWSLLTTTVTSVVIAPGAARIMYALKVVGAGVPLAVERSDDGGVTWHQVGTLATAAFSAVDSLLTVSPSDPNVVYAAGAKGFFASTDGGATWGEAFAPGITADDHLQPVAIAPGAAQTLYLAITRPTGESSASVYRSDDGGASWVASDAGLAPRLLSFGAGPSGTLYASTDSGGGSVSIFASADRGASWQPTASGLPNATLTAGSGTPDRLYLTSFLSPAILISQDQGKSWDAATRSPSGAGVAQVLIGPAGGGSRLYVTADGGPLGRSESSLWESPDGGATWRTLAPSDHTIHRLALDAQPGVLYSINGTGSESFPTSVSRDDGSTWQLFPTPTPLFPATLAADPRRPGKAVGLDGLLTGCGFLCFRVTYSLELTNTGGRGWRLLGSGVEDTVPLVEPLFVRLEPGHPAMAYAAIGAQLFAPAPDHTLAALPLRGPLADLVVIPRSAAGGGPTLYAAANRPRILWKSGDGGAHWSPASFGLPHNVQPVALAVDPADAATLYLATAQQVFVTDDAAASWRALTSDGLPAGFSVTALAVSPAPAHTLFAGTDGAGVFALALP